MHRGPLTPRLPRILLVGAFVSGVLALAVAFASGWGSKAPRGDRAHANSSPLAQTPAAGAVEPGSPGAATVDPNPPSTETGKSAPSAAGASPVGTAGMLVGIDPETGRPGRPSEAFRAKLAGLAPGLDRSSDGLTVVTRPDGSQHVNLQGRFQEYTVVRLTPDGRKVEDCVDGPDVDAALHSDAAPAPALEEK